MKPQSLRDQKVITVSIAKTRQIKTGIKIFSWVAAELDVPCEAGIFSSSFVQSRNLESRGSNRRELHSKVRKLFRSVYHTLSWNSAIFWLFPIQIFHKQELLTPLQTVRPCQLTCRLAKESRRAPPCTRGKIIKEPNNLFAGRHRKNAVVGAEVRQQTRNSSGRPYCSNKVEPLRLEPGDSKSRDWFMMIIPLTILFDKPYVLIYWTPRPFIKNDEGSKRASYCSESRVWIQSKLWKQIPHQAAGYSTLRFAG